MKRLARTLLLALPLLAMGCHHLLPPLPLGYDPTAVPLVRSLEQSVLLLAWAPTNVERQRRVEQRAAELGLAARTEPIDLYTRQHNVIVDLPGGDGDLIYLVAHYDKTDSNPFELASLLLNGSLNRLTGLSVTSEGAIDNATGVATVLQLGHWLAAQPTRTHSYRLLLTGGEEMGLRGSRAHLARLGAAERDRILLAINLDALGTDTGPDCAIAAEGAEEVAGWLSEAAGAAGHPLGFGRIPAFATSDHATFLSHGPGRDVANGVAFSLVGGLLPQRSWFTTRHRAPVVTVSECALKLGLGEVGSMFMLPTGVMHGPRDNLGAVDPVRLHESYQGVQAFLAALETGQHDQALRAMDQRLEGAQAGGEGETATARSLHEQHR